MRVFFGLLILALSVLPATAQFLGGVAEGMIAAQQLEQQRRALELDARDGGDRYYRLRQQQQMDELNQQLKRNNELLEQYRMEQWLRRR